MSKEFPVTRPLKGRVGCCQFCDGFFTVKHSKKKRKWICVSCGKEN